MVVIHCIESSRLRAPSWLPQNLSLAQLEVLSLKIMQMELQAFRYILVKEALGSLPPQHVEQ